MSRRRISLKSRVRYEGRAQDFDRRPTQGEGSGLEKLPNPVLYMVSQVLRKNFTKVVRNRSSLRPVPVPKID